MAKKEASRTSLLVRAAFGAVVVGTPGDAWGQASDTHAIASVGIARPMMNHALYGFGPTAAAGADFALGNGDAHRMLTFGRWIGLPATGARADIGSLEAAWRWQPQRANGGFVQVGAGLLFEVERLMLTLPGRSVDESHTRVGAPLSIAVGFRAWSHVEVDVGYQQIVFFREQPRTVGVPHLSIGGRL